jgi:hypothetical protein
MLTRPNAAIFAEARRRGILRREAAARARLRTEKERIEAKWLADANAVDPPPERTPEQNAEICERLGVLPNVPHKEQFVFVEPAKPIPDCDYRHSERTAIYDELCEVDREIQNRLRQRRRAVKPRELTWLEMAGGEHVRNATTPPDAAGVAVDEG